MSTRIRIERLSVRVRAGTAGERPVIAAAVARALRTHPALAGVAGEHADAAGDTIARAVAAAAGGRGRR